LKLRTNIIILSVLFCFVTNNLLFTYAIDKKDKIVMVCESDEGECLLPADLKDMCCDMEDCCARVPVQSAHVNVSVIMGLEKDSQPPLRTPEFSNFSLSQLDQAAELSEGHLSSLIKPPSSTVA
jgi:hypothetical protein